MRQTRTRKGRRSLIGGIAALAALAATVGTAEAASFVYVNTGAPIPANTAYFSSIQTHTGNQMFNCQNPTFSAAIYLTTTGGTQIRRVDGNCPLANTGHSAEASTRANCANKAATPKFASCRQYYI